MQKKAQLLLILTLLTLFSACSRQGDHQAQGYVEGRYTYMATNVSGRLEKLLVQRGTKVKTGQLLFVLENQPEMDAYFAALANQEQAMLEKSVIKPNLEFARLTYHRYQKLLPKNAIEQSQLDNAKANFDSLTQQLVKAEAALAAAKAQAAQAQWTLAQKQVNAPVDAIVFDTYYRTGEYTESGKAILSLLAPENIKVIFYINEKYLGGIQLGDEVAVHCDGCADDIRGKISFISPSAEYTPPVIYSNETSEKLVFRIEAAVSPETAYKLHPGQPAIVTYRRHG